MNKTTLVRQKIWGRLRDVALPDSRFHLNFAEVIPDFQDSARALDRLAELPCYDGARHVFITPDNCLAELRTRLLKAGKSMVVSTYGIYRGFILLTPDMVPAGQEEFAGWLDGLEHFGRPVSLAQVADLGRFDFMATGASAVARNGVRFGKGHGFFDMEWGMFTDIGIVDEQTPVIAVVHDVQVVEERLTPSPTDIIVDYICTPGALYEIPRELPRPRGIHWDLVDDATLEATPPLRELQQMRGMAAP
jgi:5-formyltetrahydrofolate cyclo-ligase